MLSTSKLVLVVAPWQIISRNALGSSLSLSRRPTRSSDPASVVARSVRRISATFKGGLSGPSPSSSCFGSSSCCRSSVTFKKSGVEQQHQEQYRRKNSRRRQPGKNVLVDSGSRTCASLKGGPLYNSSSAFSSTSFRCSSVAFRRLRAGQQQQQRRRSSSIRHQMSSIIVEAIASPDALTANLNQKPLYDELQRYGVDESDYDCTASNLGRQQPNFSLDLKKHKTTSSKLRKRKATAELTSGSQEQQLPTLKDESGVVEDWCAYLLLSGDLKKTYVGVTYDIRRRLRQHNGEIAGGAKSARTGRPWRLVCTVRGFNNRSEACQFEWTWKSTAAKIKTITQLDSKMVESHLVTRRRATLAKVLKAKEEWSYLNVQWHAE